MNPDINPESLVIDDEKVSKAFQDLIEMEYGVYALDVHKYKELIGILKKNDQVPPYFRFPPLLAPKVQAALQQVKVTHREYYESRGKATEKTAKAARINRRLTLYAQNEPWRDEMHVTAIFSWCHFDPRFNPRYLQLHFKEPMFDKASLKVISRLLFEAPDMRRTYFHRGDDINAWKEEVGQFLGDLSNAPPACILIFLAIQLETLFSIKKDLKKSSKNAWTKKPLSKEDQLWFFSRVHEVLVLFNKDRKTEEKNVSAILNDFKGVLDKISNIAENQPEASSVVAG